MKFTEDIVGRSFQAQQAQQTEQQNVKLGRELERQDALYCSKILEQDFVNETGLIVVLLLRVADKKPEM